MSSIGRPLMPPDLLMRSTAICVPTSAVLPPAAAAPESGCSVPTLYGLARPKAACPGARTCAAWPGQRGPCHGAGPSMLAPSAPAAAEPYPINRRRVTLPRYQNASLQFCVFASSVIVSSSQIDCNGAGTRHELPLSECAAHRAWSCFPQSRDVLTFCRILQDIRAHNERQGVAGMLMA